MKKTTKVLRVILALLLVPAASLARGVEPIATGDELSWVVAGPFPVAGENALFKNYLGDLEEGKSSATLPIAGKNATGALTWQAVTVNQLGEIDFHKLWPDQKRAIAFAYAQLASPAEKSVAATIGSGSGIQLRLNGEVIYECRLSRKPEPDTDTVVLRLRKGTNTLLAKVEGAQSIWQFQMRVHQQDEKVFINKGATIVPDFIIGKKTHAWAQVELANVGETPLANLTVGLRESGLNHSVNSTAETVAPGQVVRIPFRVDGKVAPLESAGKPLRLHATFGEAAHEVEVMPRVKKPSDYFVTTYRSAVDGSVQPYSVLLPPAHDPKRTYPLIVLLHGAHVTSWGQNMISYAPKEWAIQVAVHDRGNNRYRDIGEVDLEEVFAEVNRNYKIDAERIYLAGHSMGGYGTWFQATRRPDRWASISPQAGYVDFSLYQRRSSDGSNHSVREFQKRLVEHWSPLAFAENLLYVPSYIVHGAKDDNVAVEHSRKMAARLRELGYTFVYDENPAGGHWWGPRGANYGTEIVDKPPIWNFIRKHSPRVHSPRRVVYTTDTLRYRKAYWIAIDELDTANQLARVEAKLKAPNTISIQLSNTTQITLRLDDGLVNLGEPVKVQINDRLVFHNRLGQSTWLTLRRQPGGNYVRLLKADGAGDQQVKKTEKLYGPVSDAFNTPFLFVTGTRGTEKSTGPVRRAANRAALVLARDWMARANGIVRIKRDTEVTAADIHSNNLILFGNASTNSLIAQTNGAMPIRFVSRGVSLNGQIKRGADLGVVMVRPNPLDRKHYVVVVGGTSEQSFATAARLRFGELPDYVVFDGNALVGNETNFIAGGFFDKYWRLIQPRP